MKAANWVALGALLAAIAVAAGAFGAHALRERLEPRQLEVWITGVRYQMWHALALVLFGLFQRQWGKPCLAGWCFLLGTLLFSGSLYALALGGPSWLGPVTPLGGTLLIVGWIFLVLSAKRAARG